jgi:Ca2+-binding EF-hand superfamily protein
MMGGIPINDKVWNEMLSEVDKNGDGMISHNEFIDLFLKQSENNNLLNL